MERRDLTAAGGQNADGQYTDDQIADGLSETARTVNRLMIALLAVALFSLLAIGQPDAYLLDTAARVNVPSVGATSAKALLIVGPLLLIGVRVYLQVYVEHWRRLDAMANERALERPLIVSPLRHGLLSVLAGAVLYLLVPAVLAAFTWKAMVFPQSLGYGLLFVTVFVTAAHALQSWRGEWYLRLYFCANVAAVVGLIGVHPWLDDLRRHFDLRYADLHNTDLANTDLRDADLRQANLAGADLRKTNLQRANLTLANLENAIADDSKMQKADLSGAHLEGARLTGAKLQGAILFRTNLMEAHLWYAKLQGADLLLADLQGADLRGAKLQGAKLSGAKLQGAKLRRAKLQGASLRVARLQGANLTGAYLKDAILAGACGDKDTKLPEGYSIPDCDAR